MLKKLWTPDTNELPEIVPPRELSTERQRYLFEQICPFCPDEDKDTMCPMPTVPNPDRCTPAPEEEAPCSPKRQWTCKKK